MLQLTLKYNQFRSNMARLVAHRVQQELGVDKQRKQAWLVVIYHESSASRELTVRLIRRLQELGESLCLFTDLSDPPALDGVHCRSIIEEGRSLSHEEIRRQISACSPVRSAFCRSAGG